MSAADFANTLQSLSRPERMEAARRILESLCSNGKVVERIMRRIENPDIQEDVWRGIEDAEDGRTVEMETALYEKPPEK